MALKISVPGQAADSAAQPEAETTLDDLIYGYVSSMASNQLKMMSTMGEMMEALRLQRIRAENLEAELTSIHRNLRDIGRDVTHLRNR
jgi:hypothetical protein